MTDRSDGDSGWVYYRNRPEWKDIQPIPQNDGPFPVVQIAYSEKFRDIFDYVRAILAKNEISERAFQLSGDAALANPANYTIWHFRRILLKELNKDLREELIFVEGIIKATPKNYQIWYHRQVIVEWLDDPSSEKAITEEVLEADEKNYHAWQHRQWAIKKYQLWEGELDYINKLLESDVRNNSAWNQRYFVVTNALGLENEVLASEIKYTLDSITKVTLNESAWNYLRGILQDKGLTKYPQVTEFTEKLYDSGCRSPYLLAFIIDAIEERLLAGDDPSLCLKAIELCDALAKKHDIIRKEYWNFVARNLGNLYGPEEARAKTTET